MSIKITELSAPYIVGAPLVIVLHDGDSVERVDFTPHYFTMTISSSTETTEENIVQAVVVTEGDIVPGSEEENVFTYTLGTGITNNRVHLLVGVEKYFD